MGSLIDLLTATFSLEEFYSQHLRNGRMRLRHHQCRAVSQGHQYLVFFVFKVFGARETLKTRLKPLKLPKTAKTTEIEKHIYIFSKP